MAEFNIGDEVIVDYGDFWSNLAAVVIDGATIGKGDRDGEYIYIRTTVGGRTGGFTKDSLTLVRSAVSVVEEDLVNNPSHYTQYTGFEAIEITEQMAEPLTANVIKYVLRAPFKGNELQDLHKARFYLNRRIENLETGTYGIERTEA